MPQPRRSARIGDKSRARIGDPVRVDRVPTNSSLEIGSVYQVAEIEQLNKSVILQLWVTAHFYAQVPAAWCSAAPAGSKPIAEGGKEG